MRRSILPSRATVVTSLVVAALVAHAPSAVAADPPSADQIVAQMKSALEPAKPSFRRFEMTVKQGGEQRTFELIQARKPLADGPRSVTVILAPDDAKGLAYLVAEKGSDPDNREWLYIPVVRRVRELVPAENYTSFLDTDFTYADLGFLDPHMTNKLLGVDNAGGKTLYRVESIPGSTTKQWYYSRIVTSVDAETLLPVKREFYSPSNMLFKVERFDDISRVDGIATPFRITMENLPAKSSTELHVVDLAYSAEMPDEIFSPDKLSTLAGVALWKPKASASK
jgi:hypothetical protein